MFRETPVMIKQSDLKLQWKRQERNENMKIKHLALVLAGVLLLTGCGSGQAAGTAEEDSSAKTNQTVDEANKGMGRYVEAETDLSDICRSAAGLRLTKDGTLYLCDAPGAVYESTDQGENWNPYELPSLEEVVDQSPIYFITMDMAEDGSLWAVGDHSVNEDEWNPQLMHFPKEGRAQIFDKLSLESGEQPCQVRVSDNGKVFLADYGANIYEVKEDQTVTKVLTADGRFSNLQIHNNLLAFYPDDGTGMKIYDLDQKEYVEDAVLDQFMQENYPGASRNGYSSFQVFYFWGNDDAFYVAVSSIAAESNEMYSKLPYTGGSTGLDYRHGLAPFPLWLAFLSRISGLKAVTVCHIAAPLMLIPMTYGIYWLIGRKLCKKGRKDKLPLFLIFTELLVLFGDYSIYSVENFMIARSRQGKAALGSIIFPFLIYVFLLLLERLEEKEKAEWMLWVLLACTVTSACLCSTLGAFLVCLVTAVVGLCSAVCYRQWKFLFPMAACCIPAVFFALLYLIS